MPSAASAGERSEEERLLKASLTVLDLFMQAGQREEVVIAAKWMMDYDSLKSRTVYDSSRMIRRHKALFSGYESVDEDIYGFEVNRGVFGTEIYVEGMMKGGEARVEYAAVLVFKNNRWKIQKLDLG